MTEYVQLATDDEVDDFRAEMWVRFYEDALTRWAEWLSLPAAELPPSVVAYRDAGGGPPTYGQPLDFHGGSASWRWQTQACHGILVHPISGGGGVVEVAGGRGGAKSRVRQWIESGDEVTVLAVNDLRDLRDVGMDAAATRARALLGNVPGKGRQRMVKTLPNALVERKDLVGRWQAKIESLEEESQSL